MAAILAGSIESTNRSSATCKDQSSIGRTWSPHRPVWPYRFHPQRWRDRYCTFWTWSLEQDPKKVQVWAKPKDDQPAELTAIGRKPDAAVFGQAWQNHGTIGEV